MLYEESLWFKNIIQKHAQLGSLVLNIGSSTKEFIEVTQPYIKVNLFDEFASKNCIVKNVDIKQAEGVDLVGDVTDPEFVYQLKQLNASFIICSNLLEHLTERTAFCEALVKIMNADTKLIISVPYQFPYHEDPIDTMYRPTLNELQKAFPTLKLVEGQIVDCGTYFNYSTKNLSAVTKLVSYLKLSVASAISSFTNKEKHERLIANFKHISATCAIYKTS
jgi:predicted SAM-dependent methyltransferase